jgi:hypothetical protein
MLMEPEHGRKRSESPNQAMQRTAFPGMRLHFVMTKIPSFEFSRGRESRR